ncbi:MAG: hypothetical protein QM675_07395 [Protaetiibacter sp.]
MKISKLGVVGAIVASLLVATPAHADGGCDTYLLIGARGTDEAPRGSDPYDELNWDGSGILANRIFTNLEPVVVANGGTISRYGVRYAADMDLAGFATEVMNAAFKEMSRTSGTPASRSEQTMQSTRSKPPMTHAPARNTFWSDTRKARTSSVRRSMS